MPRTPEVDRFMAELSHLLTVGVEQLRTAILESNRRSPST
jgi:hypothetical protein